MDNKMYCIKCDFNFSKTKEEKNQIILLKELRRKITLVTVDHEDFRALALKNIDSLVIRLESEYSVINNG